MRSICFATLALGPEYRHHARLLANDLAYYARDVRIIVLTDEPGDFSELSNVDAHYHKTTGNWYCYHDKRHVIQKALAKYKTTIFLDADCRLIDSPPLDEYSGFSPGIRGLNVINIEQKLTIEEKRTNPRVLELFRNTPSRRRRLLKRISKNINADYANSYFVLEALIIITQDDENIIWLKFLAAWDYLAGYLSVRNYEWGEGESIGLAANYVGWRLDKQDNVYSWLFKDYFKDSYKIHGVYEEAKLNKIEEYIDNRKKIFDMYKEYKRGILMRYTSGALRYIRNAIIFFYRNRDLKRKLAFKSTNRL